MRIRDDLVGVTIVRAQAGKDVMLAAGDEVPDGVTVGAHLLTEVAPTVPAKAGPGSGAKAWRDYAAAVTAQLGLSIDIPDDASRADIIEALEGASIPTE